MRYLTLGYTLSNVVPLFTFDPFRLRMYPWFHNEILNVLESESSFGASGNSNFADRARAHVRRRIALFPLQRGTQLGLFDYKECYGLIRRRIEK